MALTDFASAPVAARPRGILTRIAEILDRLAAAQSRAGEVERLNAMSDAELARMGLKREDIARHVFRDILYI